MLRYVVPLLLASPGLAVAAASDWARSEPVDMRLVTAQQAVAPGSATLSSALQLKLGEGWKTYWRNPGEVGLPPEIDWSGSENVADAEILWPAPTRFEAFGIQNYGYAGEVALPIEIALERPGEPAALRAEVSALVCSEICVPANVSLALDLPAGAAAPDAEAAALIAEHVARVPDAGEASGLTLLAAAPEADGRALVTTARAATPFAAPDLFIEAAGRSFGPPELRLSEDGRILWARTPLVAGEIAPGEALAVTLVDGARAATLSAALAAEPPAPPDGAVAVADAPAEARSALLWTLGLAFLGGLILNVMPCVLPVLSMKLGHAVDARGHAPGRVRLGFLATAAGVIVSMWAVAAATLAAREAGLAVGWGLQFQNPVFLAFMTAVVVLFAANMIGLFEVPLPSWLGSRAATAGRGRAFSGDFAAGAFAALLATPCSAPFLGAAVAYALTGGAGEIALIFTALGLGLAAPYLALAAWPRALAALPRPGPWMVWVKAALGGLLLLTGLWLLWVLAGVAGPVPAAATAAALALAVALIALRRLRAAGAGLGVAAAASVAAALAAPAALEPAPPAAPPEAVAGETVWIDFDRTEIARAVSRGETVLVDVTADWCLTCKANKALVLDREPVRGLLRNGEVSPMRADWTRPDESIARYLAAHGRYGIPFNAVYGPGAPEGIVLPELLSTEAVLEAVETAGRRSVAGG